MDAPRREYERPLGEGQLRCRVWYPTWNIRQEDGACIHRPSVQWALHFVDRGRWQHVVRRIDSRHPRRKLRDGRHSHPRSWSPAVRAVESTDGGANFTLLEAETVCLNPTLAGNAGIIQSSFGSTRGVNHVERDPSTASTIYAAAFPRNNSLPLNTGGGAGRSTDHGEHWHPINA